MSKMILIIFQNVNVNLFIRKQQIYEQRCVCLILFIGVELNYAYVSLINSIEIELHPEKRLSEHDFCLYNSEIYFSVYIIVAYAMHV